MISILTHISPWTLSRIRHPLQRDKHRLRKKDDDENKDKGEEVALENSWVDPEKLLIEASESQPESQKGFDRKHDLKTAHALWTNSTKDINKHIDSCTDCREQCPRDDLADMHHNRFTGFGSARIGMKNERYYIGSS